MSGTQSTPEADAELTRLWLLTDSAGRPVHSCAAIGRLLGRTSNSIHGRVTRLRLPLRQSPIVPKGTKPTNEWSNAKRVRGRTLPALPSTRAERRVPGHAAARPVSAPAPVPDVQRPTDNLCTFIVNDRRPWRYCDAPAPRGRSFCPEHHARCFVKSPRPFALNGIDHG